MGIRPLGLTCAVCWLLSCHLEAISVETVSAACCALVLQEAQPSMALVPRSQEPFASFRISSVNPSEALRCRLPSGPLLSLPFPLISDLESSDTCRGTLASLPIPFLAHFAVLKGRGCR